MMPLIFSITPTPFIAFIDIDDYFRSPFSSPSSIYYAKRMRVRQRDARVTRREDD
jgi:hypothetical protein